jgi:DNA-binding transcriptional regulator YiaG
MQRFYRLPYATVKHVNRSVTAMTPHEWRSLVWLREMTASGEARRIRERAHLTGSEGAAIVRVPAPTFQSWESGRRRPTGEAALRYAEFLTELTELAKQQAVPA